MRLGRIPETNECECLPEVTKRLGSTKRALRAYVQGGGVQSAKWEQVRVQFGIGQPRVSASELLGWVADWVQRSGPDHGKPTNFESRDGRF